MVCDVDDIIFNITPKWTFQSFRDKHLNRHIKNREPLRTINNPLHFINYVLTRETYYLNDWLQIPKLHQENFLEIYSADPFFYDDLRLTPFGKSLLLLKDARHVYFVSHVMEDVVDESKKKRLLELFKINATYLPVPFGQKKSEVINAHCPDFDIFVDDAMSNHLDVLTNCKSEGKNFVMPLFRHNAPLLIQHEDLINKLHVRFGCYDNFIEM